MRLNLGAPYSLNPTTTAGPSLFSLDGSTDANEAIIQTEEPATITHVGFRYGTRTGTPPTYRISIQGVDASGNPDGTIKGGGSPASATFTPPASTAWNGTWQWIALSNSYACGRGEFLALVIDYSSGTINGSNFGSFTNNYSGYGAGRGGFPYAIQNDATVRTRQGNYPSYGYKSSTKTYGTPWVSANSTTFSSDSTPNEYGLTFTLPSWGGTYTLLGVRTILTTPAAGKTVILSLYDGTTPIQTVTFDSDAIRLAATAIQITEFYFDETTLTPLVYGAAYSVAFAPQQTATNLAVLSWSASSAQDAQAPGGDGLFYLVTRSGGAWTSDTSTRPAMELIVDATAAASTTTLFIPVE